MGAGKMPDIDEASSREELIAHGGDHLFHDAGGETESFPFESEQESAALPVGAGVDIAEVNRLVKQFEQMKKMMKQMPGMMRNGRQTVVKCSASFRFPVLNCI